MCGGEGHVVLVNGMHTIVLGQDSLELCNCGGHLESVLDDPLLSLDPYTLGPSHKASEVSVTGEDIISNGEVSLLLCIQREGESPRSLDFLLGSSLGSLLSSHLGAGSLLLCGCSNLPLFRLKSFMNTIQTHGIAQV